MRRSKIIASSLIALLLLCVVSETAEARCRKRCRHHRRAQPCCTQTCHTHTPTCGCEASSYESTAPYDSQSSAPDAAPLPDSTEDSNQGSGQNLNQNTNSSSVQQDSDPNSGIYSEQGGAQTSRETRNNPVPPAPPSAPNN
jgi:hypothetical protein